MKKRKLVKELTKLRIETVRELQSLRDQLRRDLALAIEQRLSQLPRRVA